MVNHGGTVGRSDRRSDGRTFGRLALVFLQSISSFESILRYTKKSQKLPPRTSKSHQNEVPRGTRSHQNNENSEKVKSNETKCIYNTFEGLGHQNSQEFPFKNQQKT